MKIETPDDEQIVLEWRTELAADAVQGDQQAGLELGERRPSLAWPGDAAQGVWGGS